MKCKDIDALLDAHGIGTLSAAGKAEIASHLEHCHRCAGAWLGHEALAGETPAAPRAGFYAEALAAAVAAGDAGVEAAPPAMAVAGGSRRWGAILGLAAAAVMAAGLVWLALPDQEAAEQGATPAVADDSAESSGSGFLGDTLDLRRESGLPADLRERLEREAQARSQNFVAGVHYELLADPAPTTADAGQIEVCEFFMFGCIHCYNFEQVLQAWVASRDDRVDFVRVPALFNELAVLHAQAYYTAEALDAADAIVGPFYAEIHERGQSLATVADIRAFFVRHGVDGARFDATFDSAEVRGDLRRAAELNRLYGVDATPTIGVAGKYRTNASMAGSNEAMFAVVDALVEAEMLAEASSETSPCEGPNSCSTWRELIEQIQQHAPQGGSASRGEVVQ